MRLTLMATLIMFSFSPAFVQRKLETSCSWVFILSHLATTPPAVL